MKKAIRVLAAAAALSLALASSAFAAVGWVDNKDGRWWYSLTSNGDNWYRAPTGQVAWFWIDGNTDGTAECYCFDDGGWLLMNRTTPDGYQVNGKGQWVVNGVVQTRSAYIRSSGGNN